MALLLLGFDLEIRDGRLQDRVPVDQAFAPVDQTFVVQPDEDFGHRLRQSFVHGEAFARPVHGAAHAAHLPGDVAAGFSLPVPDLVDKGFAAEVMARAAFSGQFSLHHHLRGDAGVIRAGLPEGIVATHPVVASQRVHDGVLKRMAHVQTARDIRRGNDDAVVIPPRVQACGKVARSLPGLVPAGFDLGRVVGLIHQRLGRCRADSHGRGKTETVCGLRLSCCRWRE